MTKRIISRDWPTVAVYAIPPRCDGEILPLETPLHIVVYCWITATERDAFHIIKRYSVIIKLLIVYPLS